jgi:hypothetical protein
MAVVMVTHDLRPALRDAGTVRESCFVNQPLRVVAGGDTSAAVTEALKIYRMDMIREIEAGIPLMQGRSALGDIDLVLKSGSFGSEAFLEKAVQAVRRQVGEEQVE